MAKSISRKERREMSISTETEPLQVPVLIEKIKTAIQEKYSMNVNQFAKSKHCTKIGINAKNLPVYLSSGNSISFPALKKLCKFLGLGELKKNVEKQITVTYSL